MKISIIVHHFPPKWLAGTEIATYNLAKFLSKRGYSIEVITSYDEGYNFSNINNGFIIHRIKWSKIRIIGIIQFWLKILTKIRATNPDIILAQSFGMGMPALLCRFFLKKPFIVWGRGEDINNPDLFYKITIPIILQASHSILALTTNMQKKIKPITQKKTYIIPNGIDLREFNNSYINYNHRKNKKTILYIGRLHPIKGVEYLIIAMKKIHFQFPDIRLNIVGDGIEKVKLKNMVGELELEDCVHFVGKVSHTDILHYLRNADVFVLPSISEGFPNVLLEAMACGLPIVATHVGGIPDIVHDQVHGFLVEPKNAEKIAEKISIILNDESLSDTFSSNNLRDVVKYDYENVIEELAKVIDNIYCNN